MQINVIETLLVAGSALMAAGIGFVQSGKIWEGLAVSVVGAALFFLRGYIK